VSFVQQLNLGCEEGNAIVVAPNRSCERTLNLAVAPEYPAISIGVVQHQLKYPLCRARWFAPQ